MEVSVKVKLLDVLYKCVINIQPLIDINECLEAETCKKTEKCVNYDGYFVCEKIECAKGYSLNFTSNKCEDIDECLRRPCQGRQLCVNHPGSYSCECDKGFRNENKSDHCVDIDECTEFPYLCEHTCINFEGNFHVYISI